MGFPFRGPDPGANEDQTGVTGLLIDWAARLANGLNAPQAIMAATKAIPGILRLATDAEATAAVIDAVATTPKQVLALLRANPLTYPTLNALFADTAQPNGAVASVGRYAIGSGYHRQSVWQRTNGQWMPAGDSITIEAPDTPTSGTVLAAITTLASSNSSNAFIPPNTSGVTTGGSQQYVWTGSAWLYLGTPQAISNVYNTSSVGTGDIRIADLVNDMSDVHVHLIAPNFDRQERLWCARSPYNPGGTANIVTSTQINNAPGYGATVYSVQNYGLYARISGSGSPSPINGKATVMAGGNN